MNAQAKKEYGVLAVLAIILLASLMPSLQYARREKRDGARRDELVQMKHRLEEANNKVGYYPVSFSAQPYQFSITHADKKMALGWYIRTPIENIHPNSSGFDYEGEHNFYYRYITENGQQFYDICGGDNTCGAPLVDNVQ